MRPPTQPAARSAVEAISVFALAFACSAALLGCQGKAVSAKPAASLAGTWFGALPPSRDGSVLDNVSTEGPYTPWVYLEIGPADASGAVSGKLSFCQDGKFIGTMSFEKARLGAPAVPLSDSSGKPTQSLSFFDLQPGGNTVRAVLSGQGVTEAGYLKKADRSAFDRRCHPS